MLATFTKRAPGLGAAVATAAGGVAVATQMPESLHISGIPCSLVLGAVANNLAPANIRQVLQPGVKFATTTVLRALAFAYPMMAMGLVVTAAMVASDRHTWAAIVTAIGAALCTGLTIVLVGQMGTLGGAIALGVSHGVVLLLLLVGIRRASAQPSASTT